ncbi:beta-N-acetylhexosaminidase [Haloferula sp.]|uniref:beta-N-acetylhexosaminidase n=1 Tax=Haloferula sp. TaxID=2497595 RepID=UPI00329E8C45
MSGHHLLLGISGPELTADESSLFEKLQPAGYILFTRNIVSAEQTRALTDSLRALHAIDPIIAIDQEGGRVTRTKEIAPALPSANELSAHNDMGSSATAGILTADLLRLLGFNLNFGPVLDLDHHPDKQNALRGRCWGRDSQHVINHAGMWNRWMRKRSILSCGKHFPACGRALSDPHHDLPVSGASKSELLAEDVIPYTALMPELDSIMLAHVLFPEFDPELPSSLSPRVIRDFLRGQLGFDKHLVLTDDLDMGAIADRFPDNTDVTAALEAGNDIAMICHKVERAEDAAKRIAKLSPHVLQDSDKRLERFHKKLPGPIPWSQEKWDKTCGDIETLRSEVPTLDSPESVESSPVADY